MMRIALAAALALVALTSLATAQQAGKMPAASPVPEERPLFDEKKYRAARDSVPEARQSNDPWAGARDVTPPPAAAAAPATKPRRQP